ncbi:MAG: pirin family protein [Leptolyngbyaceae cyanobacterium SM2_5_2]|nr:pirin family protein [Leptolyngbyaceae cyanobacterium SM2_5_2]
MITIRPASERGAANFGWLDTRHTFSFGHYFDPNHMGFASLRVINEDKISPSMGFGTHGHRDMEIVTYVLSGAIKHEDSIGTGSVIRPGDVQRMSAGTGIRHSEFNASASEPVHMLQIWLLPGEAGLEPGYEQIHIPLEEKQGQLRLVGSHDGREGSVTIHQDVNLYATLLAAGGQVTHALNPGRVAWVQVARGAIELNGHSLTAGDGAAVSDLAQLALTGAAAEAEVLLFDMAV